MLHNLLFSKEDHDFIPMQETAHEDCRKTVQVHLRQSFPNEAAPGTLFRPIQAMNPMGFTWSVVLRTYACSAATKWRTPHSYAITQG